ncbi:MAG: ABC transporter ATP-binding protein [Gemmatimonadaceae bacterium]
MAESRVLLPRSRLVLALLRPHARGEGPAAATAVLLSAGAVGLHLLRPWPLKWMLDYFAGTHHAGAAVGLVTRAPATAVLVLGAAFIAIALVEGAVEYARVLRITGLGNRVAYRLRAALFAHLMAQPLAFHERREVGELLTRVVYDTSRLRRGLNGFAVQTLYAAVLFASTVTVLLWHQPTLGLVMAVGGACALLAMRRSGRRIARAARRQRRREGRLAAVVESQLRGVRELQAYGAAESMALRRFGDRNGRSLKQEQKVRRLEAGLTFRVETLLAATIALAVAVGGRAVLAGRLTAGDLVLFVTYALALRAPFASFARETARLGRTRASADRLAGLAARTPRVADLPGAVDAPPLRGELVFDGVRAKAPKRVRGARKWTLDRCSFHVPAGTRVAVVGPNGAGKSTALRLVLRLADPYEGAVRLDGRDVREYTVASLRSQLSVVFQDSVLPGLTVRESIALGAPQASDEAIREVAARAKAHDFVERLPQGYDTPLRRNGGLLSGGERQRLAIARALLRDGRVWLLDEPTTGLDPATTEELTSLLLSLTSGRTTFWITHDHALVDRLDRVLVIDQGRVTFAGTPAEYRGPYAPALVPSPPLQSVET